MTISSSLSAGVSGLNANATRLSSISDNIANSSTFGYRRSVTDFHSVVVGQQDSSRHIAGGVRTSTLRLIDEQGQLQSSSNATDIAVGGRGMLPVTSRAALDQPGTLPLSLMTTGSFRPNAEGPLITDSGMVLMGWPADPDGTIPQQPRDSAAGLQPVDVTRNQYAGNPTTEVTLGLNLPAGETRAGASGDPLEVSVEYFDTIGGSQALQVVFTPNVPGAGASNSWRMTIADSAQGGTVIADYTLNFDTAAAQGGTLDTVVDNLGAPYDPATGTVVITTATGDIEMSIGRPGDLEGLTQLASTFAPTALESNGSAVGILTGVEIDPDGIVNAIYDTGFSRPIYQVPVADVPNVNGLASEDNQTYRVTNESGPMYLWNAGNGPTGETMGYTREASTTDVARELTNLIETQRAYSSNAKIIQTVDEMLQETTNLKR